MKRVAWIAVLAGLAMIGVAIGVWLTGALATTVPPGSPVLEFSNRTEGITLETQFPLSPETAPVYRVIGKVAFYIGGQRIMETRASIPTEEEAPALAEKALEQYGGLPGNAVITKVEQVTIKKYNTGTGTVEEEYPQYTLIVYDQQVEGCPVVGPGAGISIALGKDGELLQVDKVWRSLEYDREIPIISAEEAYEKLKRHDLVEIPQCCIDDLTVSDIRLGYYAEDRDHDQEFFYPVWIFYGTIYHEIDPTLHPFIVDAGRDNR